MMRLSVQLYRSLVPVSFVFAAGLALAQDSQVKTFPTYRAAASAFVAAQRDNDTAALASILGAKAQELMTSGDPAQDEAARLSFLMRYDEAHSLVRVAPDKVMLRVGASSWELPFPIERVDGAWHFDAEEGAQELAYRRIGQNELDAIKVCGALHDAQKAYAAAAHDGNPAGIYAQRFRSKAGTENGLYWEVKEGENPSPTGALVAEATNEADDGTQQIRRPVPFHGYYYRILKAQGAHAKGGAKDYVVDGKMTAGFAFIAYPAEYRSSGVMTFIVGKQGVVYEKDLGTTTEENAKAMSAYDPDATWRAVH
ncbi:MAG TPA: DUF2950 family protein [Steroidobacteraceae bacterium]|jgi:hypothetical protein